MKRILSIALIFAIVFSFASCRNIDELNKEEETQIPTTTQAPPVVDEKKQSKEFQDENGRTVYVVDVVLPEISDNIPQNIIDYVNRVTNKFFEDACVQAQKNTESASKFMNENNSDKPWRKTISFETTYLSGYYASFLISESMSYYGSSNNNPSVYTKCFDIGTGNSVTAVDFTDFAETPEVVEGFIADLLTSKAKTDFYEDGFEINQNKLELFKEAADIERFYLTENGIGFYVGRGEIDPYETEGIFKAEYAWDELGGMFNRPEIY